MRTTVLLMLTACCPLLAGAPGPDLDTVLSRAGQYVATFERSLGTIIAEEEYVQTADTMKQAVGGEVGFSGRGVMQQDTRRTKRTTVSELLMIRLSATPEVWSGVREVLRVDGKPVAGREGRLERLLRDTPKDLRTQWQELADESARYNIGTIERDFNVPTFALVFLRDAERARSTFEKAGEERVAGANAWKVSFTELRRPTIVRGRSGDVPLRGTFWIDPADGRVLRTRLDGGDRLGPVQFRVEVSYVPDPRLGLLVPAEMKERYEAEQTKVDAKATYSNYRRFEVDARIVGPSAAP